VIHSIQYYFQYYFGHKFSKLMTFLSKEVSNFASQLKSSIFIHHQFCKKCQMSFNQILTSKRKFLSKKRGEINRPHKPLRAMVIISIPAAFPIIMNLEQLCWKTADLIWWMHYMQWSSRPGLARHYREAGLRGDCVQCTRRVINSIVKTIGGFASWTWHTKSSPKFYTTASYPTHANTDQQTNSLHFAKS
jgi:hypothetical protein